MRITIDNYRREVYISEGYFEFRLKMLEGKIRIYLENKTNKDLLDINKFLISVNDIDGKLQKNSFWWDMNMFKKDQILSFSVKKSENG